MKASRITLVKIGGSVLTEKSNSETPSFKKRTAQRLVREFGEYLKTELNGELFLFVHGVGSFGHPLAKRYKLTECRVRKSPLGVRKTRARVQELNLLLAQIFLAHDHAVFPLSPHLIAAQSKRRISQWDCQILTSALRRGSFPLLHGDVLEDSHCGFSVCSGDQIVAYLSKRLPVSRVIFVTDVDGLFTRDPKRFVNARAIPSLTKQEASVLGRKKSRATTIDVTNSMTGKLDEISTIPCPVFICNGLKRKDFLRVLQGKRVGTLIV